MMTMIEFEGIWTPTAKCFQRLGIDFEEAIALQQSELKGLIADDLAFISVLLKSGLYITGDSFKLRFAHPKSGKLKTIRKGKFLEITLNKKNRTVLHFIDSEGDKGCFVFKKGKLVDKNSPFEFKKINPKTLS